VLRPSISTTHFYSLGLALVGSHLLFWRPNQVQSIFPELVSGELRAASGNCKLKAAKQPRCCPTERQFGLRRAERRATAASQRSSLQSADSERPTGQLKQGFLAARWRQSSGIPVRLVLVEIVWKWWPEEVEEACQ